MSLTGSTRAEAVANLIGATAAATPAPAVEPAAPPIVTPGTGTGTAEKTTGPVVSDPANPAAPVTAPAEATPTTTTPAQELDILDLPTAPDVSSEIDDLFNTEPEKTATPEGTTPTQSKPGDAAQDDPTADADLDAVNLEQIQRNKDYKVRGTRFHTLYSAHKAARDIQSQFGFDIRTPDGVAAINELADAAKGLQQLFDDIRSPEEVKHFAAQVIKWDPQGGVAKNLVNSVITAAPELRAEFEAEIGDKYVVNQLGEIYKTIEGDPQVVANVKASVKWIAAQLGIEMKDIEAVEPKPRMTPEQLENIRLKRMLQERDQTQNAGRAAEIHRTAGTAVTDTVNGAINSYIQSLLPKLAQNNLPEHLTSFRTDVTLELKKLVSDAFKSDPDFVAAVRSAKAEIDSGKLTDPGKVVQIYRGKLKELLSPSDKLGQAYKRVHKLASDAKAKYTQNVQSRVTGAAAQAAAPVATASTTPAVKPEIAIKPGETKQQAMARILAGYTAS